LICCSIIAFIGILVFIVLGIIFSIGGIRTTEYHQVGTITQVDNNTYQATIQCEGGILQNITKQCNITSYNIIINCTKFPSEKLYMVVIFWCNNPEFIAYLEGNEGGEYHKQDTDKWTAGIILWAFLILWILCCIPVVGLLGFATFATWDSSCSDY